MDRQCSEIEEIRKESFSLGIYLLDAFEGTFTEVDMEKSDLIDTDDALIRDDDEIEFIIRPDDEDENEKYRPIHDERHIEESRWQDSLE